MTIENGSDLIITLTLKDDKGNNLRVSTKPSFFVKVFTTDKNRYLEFDKSDVTVKSDSDQLYISADQLAVLESGVIAYSYGWGITDSNFGDNEYNRIRTVYTDYYFKNTGATSEPSNPINHQTIQQIKNRIADEVERATAVENSLSERIDAHSIRVEDNTLIITI